MLATPQGKALLGVKEMMSVFDVSNVILYVLDPRDPINSRNINMEQYILNLQQKDATKNIQLYYVLNKIDLIPASQ
eukprot:UN06826